MRSCIQDADLTEDCVPETQNPDQPVSQSGDIIAILANMSDGGVDMFSSTPTFKHMRICDDNTSLVKEWGSTSILKHIGLMEEDLEIFVDVVDNRFAPTLPGAKYDRALNTLPTPTWSLGSVEALIIVGGACCELSKVASVWGMKSLA